MQQYLIEFPDGRVQALSIAWDTRPRDQGGQRWFHLYPDGGITHKDPLHWTKLRQNWNFMCAECHSTGVRKNYDAKEDRFATSFAEISVGCEACHGAGSSHVAWAREGKRGDPLKGLLARFDERTGVSWSADPSNAFPRRSAPPASLRKEVETCGLCHARRGQLAEDWKPGQLLSETHRVSLLDRRLFHADGQMRDDEETYNYAPFKLSRMFAAGVTCSDCHDPHSGKLKAAVNDVCGQCHAPAKYQTVAHRQHAGPDLNCASCHMPARSYMVVDRRHDHGFRIPRPDLSVKFGTPNACNDCHKNQSAQWAAEKVAGWFGERKPDDRAYVAAFHAAWTEQPDAQRLLATVASSTDISSYARASAMAELPGADVELAKRSLADPDPTVRIGALDMLEGLPAGQLFPIAGPALTDPIRGVRIRAAELLASVSSTTLSKADREAFAGAATDFVAAQRLNADRPEARTALGNFAARQGNVGEAEAEYRAALRLDPFFSAAAINLADLYRGRGRDSEGEQVLRDAIAESGQDASIHHALGLTLVRLKQSDAALDELRRAADLAPEQARYAYIYAVGLQSAGRRGDAIGILRANLQRHPNDRDSLAAMINFSGEVGDTKSALDYAERLVKLTPNDASLAKLIDDLRRLPIQQNRH
ncbi:cytochrome c3 family protein [Bradyrhizobium sp. AUGA SZCCT0283]|uniref:cytochrome c3 family protein n=1 Tax=Bradyrhizobium sp. AUGA SZCCT0283 TaxID=2807671 RepID=UPI0028A1D122|nr:cytochrome c3 family protein [Bradyrhizobium sp. AUGA SZCCT0283]